MKKLTSLQSKDASARLTKNPFIPPDLKWDNKRKSFPELKNRLEAHIIQAGMTYMIKPIFAQRYKKHRIQTLNYYKKTLDISKAQFLHDLDVLYGYLKSAFRTGLAMKHLRTYESTYDDIRVYDAIDQAFGLGGDKTVLIQHYETIINEKYHRDHPDGITGFVDHLEDAFAELESLQENYTDWKKFQFWTRNLLVVGLTDWMVRHCESNHQGNDDSFRDSCKWLRSKDAQSNYSSSNKASRKARISRLEEDNTTQSEGDRDNDFLVNYTNSNYICGANSVPSLLWRLLDPGTQKVICEARNELERGNGGGIQ